MAKKNLPYLPLYTGDWIKDCNVLSLEAEAAWLRIIFKMFNGGKQSVYKVSTKALQNLWRVNDEKALCIIEELLDNDICSIVQDDRYVTFTSRRYEKENRISEIRKEAVSKRKDRTNPDADSLTKDLQSAYKTDTNDVQNAEIEIEIENNNIDNNINNTTEKINSNTRGKNGFDYSVEFEMWWNLYDKKVGDKKKLMAKWRKIPKREIGEIFKHTKRYVQATPDKKYRKNPQTYLNNESWNDEIIESNGKTNRTDNDNEELGQRLAETAIRLEYERYDSGEQTAEEFERRIGFKPVQRHLRNA